MHKLKYFLIIFFIINIYSCKKDDIGGPVKKITLLVYQNPGPNGSTFLLSGSGGSFDCHNIKIGCEIRHDGHYITVDFGNTYLVGNCSGASNLGDAAYSEKIDFGDLPVGTYYIRINNNGKANDAELIITQSSFSFTLKNSYSVDFYQGFGEMNRIPTNLLWGSITEVYQHPTTDSIMKSFLDSLNILGATHYIPPLGPYSWFYVRSSTEFSLVGLSGDTTIMTKYNGNLQSIKNLIQHYCTQSAYPYKIFPEFYSGKSPNVMKCQ